MDMSARAKRWGWRRLLPVVCVLAIAAQFGAFGGRATGIEYVDMTISKSELVDPVRIDDNITYRLDIRNRGLETARGVTVTDELPAGVVYVSANATDGGSCSGGGTVVCSGFNSFFPGESGRVTIVVKTTATGSPRNVGRVSTTDYDYNSGNNSSSETTTVLPPQSANVTISKSGPSEVTVEDDYNYGLSVRNNGPDPATNVVVTDQLPSAVSFQSATGCAQVSEASGLVSCTIGALAVNQTVSPSITVSADDLTPEAKNSASVQWSTAGVGGNAGSNEVSTNIKAKPVPKADVAITKSGPSSTVYNGQQFSYSLSVDNLEGDPADNVKVTDLLSSSVSFVSASSPCEATTNSETGVTTVECELGTLAASDAPVGLSITVQADEAGRVSNSATVETSTDEGTNTPNNTSDTVQVDVEPTADVSVAKEGPDNSVRAGQPYAYELTVTNDGPDDATGVEVTDNLPAGVSVHSEGVCDETSAGVVKCGPVDVAAGESETFSFQVVAAAPGTVSNTATVSTTTHESNTGNNSGSDSTVITPKQADVSIAKTASEAVVTGESITYTLNVSNAGPDAAEAVTAADTLPATVSYAGSNDGCSLSGGVVTCGFGAVGVGPANAEAASFTVTANQSGTVSNTATVSSSTADPNSGNNSGSDSTVVSNPPPPPDADVSATMSDSIDPVTVGGAFSYTIGLSNAGPGNAENIEVVSTLSAGLSPGAALPTGCTASGKVITCTALASLASGAASQLTIPVVADAAGSQNNVAQVSSNAPGRSTKTAGATESTTVNEQQQAAPPPPPQQEEETLDGCPTAARHPSGNPSDGLLAFVPAAIQLEQQRRRRLSLVDDAPAQRQKKSKRSRSKVIKIVAVIAALAVAAVVGVLMLTGGDKGKDYATLGGIEGRVDLQKPGDGYERAQKASTLDIGDKVRTGDDGLARIDYTDGSLTRLDHNTTFQVQELINNSTHKSIKTNLDVGRVWHRVEKLTKQEDRFEVKTVTAVATVHGTTFVNDCRFQNGGECSHITLFGDVGILTKAGEQSVVSGGQCKTEEGDEIGPCRFTQEELKNDPFLKEAAALDILEKGDVIVLPDIFGSKKAALVPVEEEAKVQTAQEIPSSTTPSTEEPACPTGEPASRGTSLPLAGAIALMVIFFGIAWARPNRKSDPTADSAN